jgi:hypothetical protein
MNRPRTNRRIRRLCAVSAAAAAFVASAGTAEAADYDDRSLYGFMKTASGAVATAGMQCGRIGTLVIQAQGDIRPQLYSYRATNSAGASTGWRPWMNVYSFSQQGIISAPGYWLVEVQIAHNNGWAWSTDKEYATVSVQPAGFSNAYWCKVTG